MDQGGGVERGEGRVRGIVRGEGRNGKIERAKYRERAKYIESKRRKENEKD